MSYIVVKLSPVQQLHQLLERHGAESDDVSAYFSVYKEQACATCLVLACSQQAVMQTVRTVACMPFSHQCIRLFIPFIYD